MYLIPGKVMRFHLRSNFFTYDTKEKPTLDFVVILINCFKPSTDKIERFQMIGHLRNKCRKQKENTSRLVPP